MSRIEEEKEGLDNSKFGLANNYVNGRHTPQKKPSKTKTDNLVNVIEDESPELLLKRPS
jgi:hypothetical protein